MHKKKNIFFETLFLFFVFVMLTSCAPKRIRLYDATDTTRSSVVVSALAQQGKPYRSGAKGPDAFDCSGLIYYVFKQHRIFLPPPAEAQGRAGYEVGRDSALPGDLVLFKTDSDFHIGIVIGGGEFVHTSKSRGVVIDSIGASYWRKRLVGYRSVL